MEPTGESRLEAFIANPRRALWRLAVPMMIGMSLHTAYTLADLFFVGRLGTSALAAVAFNMPIVFLGLGIVFGLSTGVTAVIARHIGARDKRLADSSAEHAVVIGVVLSVGFTAAAFLWGKPLLAVLGVPPELMGLAWDYFSYLAGGYVFIVLSVFFRAILAGEGDMRTPMMIQGGGTLLNILLDPLFIFTLGLGVKGAAIATVISQAVPAAVFVYLLFFKEHAYITFDARDFRFSPAVLAETIRIGAPASFSFVVMALGGAVFNRILSEISEGAVAAFQVGARFDHVYMLPVISMAAGLVTLVGMFRGAARMDLVRQIVRYAMTRSLAVALCVGALFFILAPALMGVFSDSESITEPGISYLRIVVFSYPFVAVILLTGRALQGMGRGTPMLVLSVLRVILLSGPLAYVFVFHMGKPVEWVWGAMVAGIAVTAGVAVAWLSRAAQAPSFARMTSQAAETAS